MFQGIDGFTPLTLAVTKGCPTMVSLLLAWPGVDVNLREGGGLTALHLAVLYSNKELVTMLAKDKRVNREAKAEGQTPLDMAKIKENTDEDIMDVLSKPLASSASIELAHKTT